MNTVPRPEGAGPNPPTEAEAAFRVLLDVIADVLDVPVRGIDTEERHLLLTERAEAVRLAVARTSCPPQHLAEWLQSYVARVAPLPGQEVPGE